MNFQIGKFSPSAQRTFIIAEIGNNHNGNFNLAIDLVDKAISAGADCVKFQMRHLDEVYRNRSLSKNGDDLGTEYIVDLLSKFELSTEEHKKIFDYCSSKDILYLCTPWDQSSVNTLEDFGVLAYKVSSADLTNMPLLQVLVDTNKPLILSTGMSTEDEIISTVNFLNQNDASFTLLHCNSTYPAPLHDINLRWINRLREIHPFVGYSGHERGISVSLAAAALDCNIIERHFTLDRSMEGPDHAASLTQEEFTQLVAGVREINLSMGKSTKRTRIFAGNRS